MSAPRPGSGGPPDRSGGGRPFYQPEAPGAAEGGSWSGPAGPIGREGRRSLRASLERDDPSPIPLLRGEGPRAFPRWFVGHAPLELAPGGHPPEFLPDELAIGLLAEVGP